MFLSPATFFSHHKRYIRFFFLVTSFLAIVRSEKTDSYIFCTAVSRECGVERREKNWIWWKLNLLDFTRMFPDCQAEQTPNFTFLTNFLTKIKRTLSWRKWISEFSHGVKEYFRWNCWKALKFMARWSHLN